MLNIEYIYGELSPVDFKNRDAQIRFYERNGYEIKFTDTTRRQGSIYKKLK